MKALPAACAAFGILAALPAMAQSVKPICRDGSRACLIQTAATYVAALASSDASKVPLAPNVRVTKLAKPVSQGEAQVRAYLSREAPSTGYRNARYVVDEATGEVAAFFLLGVELKEPRASAAEPDKLNPPGQMTIHLAERFRIEHGLITEIEAIYFSQPGTSSGDSGWPD